MLMFTHDIRSGNVQVPTAPGEGRGEVGARRGGFGPPGGGGIGGSTEPDVMPL